MKCKKSQEQIILYLYGELNPAESSDLEKHIQTCSACKHELEYTREVFDLVTGSETAEIPDANWEKCWGKIRSEIPETPQKQKSFASFPRWAPIAAAATVVLVFALGIFIGRFWPPSQPVGTEVAGLSPEFTKYKLQEHFDSIEPLLFEYANYASAETNGSQISVDRELIKNLLIQNFLLMRIIAQENPDARELLEDIDLVLREIKNLETDDQDAPGMIKELIHKRDILFKMEVMKKI